MRFVTGGWVDCAWSESAQETNCSVYGWFGGMECEASYNAGGDCTGCSGGDSCCKGGGCS